MSTDAEKTAVRVVVEGRVQGVGFRAWMTKRAGGLGVVGWVRNRSDGAVEAVVAGSVATVEAMLADCRIGPPAASVSRVSAIVTDWPGESGFVWKTE
jgi:acylphosphatase